MGRQGPCCHCYVPTSRHWRRGPPEKPVLCNNCGCRWANGHQLDGYLPRHSNEPNYEMKHLSSSTASSAPNNQDHRISKVEKKQGPSRGIQELTAQLHEQLQSGVLDHEPFAQASSAYDENFIYRPNWMTSSNETLLGAVLHNPPAKE